LSASAEEGGLPTNTVNLVLLRASQINGCGVCVDMHARDARKEGESDERLPRLLADRHRADRASQVGAASMPAWGSALRSEQASGSSWPSAARTSRWRSAVGVRCLGAAYNWEKGRLAPARERDDNVVDREGVIAAMVKVVGRDGVISARDELRTYECDGLASCRAVPGLVVLPRTASQVQRIVRVCYERGLPFVARGAGTGLSGGALPVASGLLIVLTRMNRIVEIDIANERVVVEPGVANLQISEAVAPYGYYYAPDPSSQAVCSIGGNVAENSGGAHCLKYGFTANHITGLEVVLADGSLVHLGGKAVDAPGYDLMGAFVGSEGTLGIATRITLRIVRKPETVRTILIAFPTASAAGAAVSAIIAARITPAALEIMDALAIEAAEAAVHAGYPPGAGALLIVELDGIAAEVDHQLDQVLALCRVQGATELRVAQDDEERARIWKGRKAAFAAVGRISPDYYVQDGVIPRSALAEVLQRIGTLAAERGLRVANVFHAGDGNLHPLVLYNGEAQAAAAEELASEILLTCLAMGGSITGEHGVGVDKKHHMPDMFGASDLDTMQRLRCAFDPAGLCNPGKVFPTPRLCGERPGPRTANPFEAAGLAEVF